jgi:hypothetical protein
MSDSLPRLLTTYDVAEWLRVSVRRINRMVRDGDIPHVDGPDGEPLFIVAELRVWLEQRKEVTSA